MSRIFLDKEQIRQQVKNLQILEIPFEFKVAKTERMYLDSPEWMNYMTIDNKMPMRELGYVKRVKDYIIKEKLYSSVPRVLKSSIDYFKYKTSLSVGDSFSDCYEIDLKSAYWETANNLGLLSPEIYNLAYKKNPATGSVFISKMTRLACIGSLARKRRIYKYDPSRTGKFKNKLIMKREKSPVTAHIWDYICFKVTKIMNAGAGSAGPDFLFFWVDAVFVTSKSARDRVIKSFDRAGFDVTVKKLNSISVILDGNAKRIIVSDKEGKRPFPLAK